MSAWCGLANPERHAPTSVTDMAWCNVCDGPCYSPEACCCCLAAEVKRLNSLLTLVAGKHMAAQERIDAALRLLDRCEEDTRDFYGGQEVPATVLTAYVRETLRGESDE